MTKSTDSFARALLAWFGDHGRHDLPWQRSPTPYHVWISEIMLQQTQVDTVRPYYERWMSRFPDIGSVADAPLDDVLHLWSGLGYYARARNLHRAAVIVRDEHNGRLPDRLDALMALPGIGRSTAAAILALAHDKRHAILDGNVKRVLARFHAVGGWPGKREVEKALWSLAEAHTPGREVAAYTQAIMDLGATLCTRSRPRCDRCPVADECLAHARGEESMYPAPRPRKARPVKETWMALFVDEGGRVRLERRPPAGIWGGLWSLPEYDSLDALRAAAAELGVSDDGEHWPTVSHGFTHYRLEIRPVLVRLRERQAVAEGNDRRWLGPDDQAGIGLAAPVAGLLQQLGEALAPTA